MITDPVEWIREVMTFPTKPLSPPQVADGNAILQAAEAKRMESLTDEQLADELNNDELNVLAVREAGRRLTMPKTGLAYDTPSLTARPGLPPGFHLTTGPGLPPDGVPCGCIHGSDHDERYFEVPPDGEPRTIEPETEENQD